MPNTSGSTEVVGKDFDLTQYGEDLTQKAKDGKLQPVIGREDEIDHIAQVGLGILSIMCYLGIYMCIYVTHILCTLFSCIYIYNHNTYYEYVCILCL